MATLKFDKSVCTPCTTTIIRYVAADDQHIAAENLVGYSTTQPSLFKYNQLEPIKDLKLLIKDYPPIAKHALTILVNISDDAEVLEKLSTDDEFLESLLKRVTVCQFPCRATSPTKQHLDRTITDRY